MSSAERNGVLKRLLAVSRRKGAAYLVLIDPEKSTKEHAGMISAIASENGADAILVGGSGAVSSSRLRSVVLSAKKRSGLPVIVFPGSAEQVSKSADAILFMSLANSRNPKYLMGEQVRAAGRIRELGLEAIATGYILVGTSDGRKSRVEKKTGTKPIRGEDVVSHALACKYLGFRTLYLEAGSGAARPVPAGLVRRVKRATGLPLIVGGGIRTPREAGMLAEAGGDFIVTGNVLEELAPERTEILIRDIARAVHYRKVRR